jgi:hypothetical protein
MFSRRHVPNFVKNGHLLPGTALATQSEIERQPAMAQAAKRYPSL